MPLSPGTAQAQISVMPADTCQDLMSEHNWSWRFHNFTLCQLRIRISKIRDYTIYAISDLQSTLLLSDLQERLDSCKSFILVYVFLVFDSVTKRLQRILSGGRGWAHPRIEWSGTLLALALLSLVDRCSGYVLRREICSHFQPR